MDIKGNKFYKKADIEVQWTGTYPNLCSGEWIIKINGIRLIDKKAPAENYMAFLRNHMGTEGNYDTWYFDDDYSDKWDSYYENGDYENDWYKSEKGKKMLELLNDNNVILLEKDLETLYQKISDEDWRNNSCGGCI